MARRVQLRGVGQFLPIRHATAAANRIGEDVGFFCGRFARAPAMRLILACQVFVILLLVAGLSTHA